jgi:hypothetical protein
MRVLRAINLGANRGKRGDLGLDGEDGSTLILIIFSAGLALALVLGVGAATSLYLERKRLFTVADGAALAAAESFDLTLVTVGEGGHLLRPVLTDGDVTRAAQEYLSHARSPHLEDLHLLRSLTEDGRSATVALSAFWRPPVVSLFFPEGIRLDVQSTARSIFF